MLGIMRMLIHFPHPFPNSTMFPLPTNLNHNLIDTSSNCAVLSLDGACVLNSTYMSTTCNASCNTYFQCHELFMVGSATNGTRPTSNYRRRSNAETLVWIFITTFTNLLPIPFLFRRHVLCKRHLVFESILVAFTLLASFCYHFCDSMQYFDRGGRSGFFNGLYLGKSKWHRLDNVGANLCFVVLLIHLCNYKNIVHADINKYIGLWLVVYCQEKDPWNMWYTVVPIGLQVIVLMVNWAVYYKKRESVGRGGAAGTGTGTPTEINYECLKRTILWLLLAVLCFIKGLDEHNDPYRLFHGLWHTFCGLGTVHAWQIIQVHNREDVANEMYHLTKKREARQGGGIDSIATCHSKVIKE